MKRNPLYIFKNLTSQGIYQVPLKSTVHIIDATGTGIPKFIELIAKTGLQASSTIAELLANPELYIDLTTIGEVYSELEKIEENGAVGWRILGRDPDNYGYIGEGAIDLSYNDTVSSTHGATGWYSVAEGLQTFASGNYGSHAEGYNTIASGTASHAEGENTVASGHASHAQGIGTIAQNESSFALGTYNVGTATDTLYELGVGTDADHRANALEIYRNGLVIVPYLEENEITNPRSLVTKEYVDELGGELEKVEEGGRIGWRIKGQNPDNHGDIGAYAIDFSISNTTSGLNGATGDHSVSFGKETIARNTGSFVVGQYNEGTKINTVVEVGIGVETSGGPDRKNALEIFRDGRVDVPELSITMIEGGNGRSLITKEYLQSLEIEYKDVSYDVTDVSQRQYTISVPVTPSNCNKPVEVYNNGLLLRRNRDYTSTEVNGVVTVSLVNNYTTNIGDWIYIKVPVIQSLDCSEV
jgi:hypothetical protein